jgi:hypothetical protein
MPREHLPTYLTEFSFRRELRDPGERFAALLAALITAPSRTKLQLRRGADLPDVRVLTQRPKPRRRGTAKRRSTPTDGSVR